MAEIVTRLVGSRKAIVTLNKELPGDPKHWQADTSLLLDLVSYQPGDITRGGGTLCGPLVGRRLLIR